MTHTRDLNMESCEFSSGISFLTLDTSAIRRSAGLISTDLACTASTLHSAAAVQNFTTEAKVLEQQAPSLLNWNVRTRFLQKKMLTVCVTLVFPSSASFPVS